MAKTLNDAINKGKETYEKAREVESIKKKTRPITKNTLINYFYDLYRVYEYGSPPIITKDTLNKVGGLVKVLKNNGYEDKDFYDTFDKIFDKWDYLKNLEIKTNNRKKYILDYKPNLMDIINCRNEILDNLESAKQIEPVQEDDDGESLFEMWEQR